MTSVFTIITASFNNLKYLNNWMESIIIQDYRPLRVVFVDDCSTDGTESRFEEYGQKIANEDIQLEYIRNSSRSYYGNCLKIGFDNSKGDFFGCLDADDALLPGAVSSVMRKYMERQDVQYIYTQFLSCDINMQNHKKGFSSIPPSGSSLLEEGSKRKHCYSHFRTFSKRIEKIDKIWANNMKCAVDKFMGYRLEELAQGMFLDRPCYLWRTGRSDSIGRTEPSIAEWHRVMREARKRRLMWKLSPIPIIYAKDE